MTPPKVELAALLLKVSVGALDALLLVMIWLAAVPAVVRPETWMLKPVRSKMPAVPLPPKVTAVPLGNAPAFRSESSPALTVVAPA